MSESATPALISFNEWADAMRRRFKRAVFAMLAVCFISICLLISVAAPFPTAATSIRQVERLLVLSIDVSASVDADEHALQREGYARAFEDPRLQRMLADGQGTAIMVLEWANQAQEAVSWTLVRNAADATRLAQRVRQAPRALPSAVGINTGVANSLRTVLALSRNLPFEAPFMILDVSGDGQDNVTLDTAAVRDQLVELGWTINTLPILAEGGEALAEWYRTNVQGGSGSFTMPVSSWEEVPRMVLRKMTAEVSETASRRLAGLRSD